MYIDTHCHVFSEYYDDIEKMKTFVVERGNSMDKHFEEFTAIVR